MNSKFGPYQVVDLTPMRRIWVNTIDLVGSPRCMYGLLEVDVTNARRFIAEQKARTGEALSFTGFLAHCLGCAVDEDKAVQAYRKGHKQLAIFDEVDVGIMVERKAGEKRLLMGHVIRGANRKTFREIHQEIRRAQSEPVPQDRGMPNWFRSAMLLPWPLSGLVRAVIHLAVRRDPALVVSMSGTVGISSVGMFGKGQGGWGIFSASHVLDLIVGGISWKPAVVEGRIEPRELLCLTVAFDHYVIDGAPAARFTQRLVRLIENGYGLEEDDQPVPALSTQPAAEQLDRNLFRSQEVF